MSQAGVVKRLRRRRIIASSEPSSAVIQQNLQALKQNIAKKKMAQDMYYSSKGGISPLTRDTNKESVHNRLGVKQLTYRKKVQVVGTSTSAIMPKTRMPNRVNFNKQQRVFSAQQRLNRIRSMQAQQLHAIDNRPKRTLRRKNFPDGVASGIVMQPLENKVIKTRRLRRALPTTGIPNATNLTVQVKNNNFGLANNNGINRQRSRRFKQILDVKLQQQITAIQAQFPGGQPILQMRVTPVSTEVALHDRFASYSL